MSDIKPPDIKPPRKTKQGLPSRASLSAHLDMERIGINPIEALWEVFQASMGAYKSGRGYGENSDAGPYYLSVAEKAATALAKFKHPTMAAIAIQDLNKADAPKGITTTQGAIEAIKQDPFAPKDVKEIDTDRVIKSMKSGINTPSLPEGIVTAVVESLDD
jgi:hypothetical protein